MTTINDWLQLLPPEIRDKAAWNIEKQNVTIKLTDESGGLLEVIASCFTWDWTPEGYAYWQDIENRIIAGEFDAKPETI